MLLCKKPKLKTKYIPSQLNLSKIGHPNLTHSVPQQHTSGGVSKPKLLPAWLPKVSSVNLLSKMSICRMTKKRFYSWIGVLKTVMSRGPSLPSGHLKGLPVHCTLKVIKTGESGLVKLL